MYKSLQCSCLRSLLSSCQASQSTHPPCHNGIRIIIVTERNSTLVLVHNQMAAIRPSTLKKLQRIVGCSNVGVTNAIAASVNIKCISIFAVVTINPLCLTVTHWKLLSLRTNCSNRDSGENKVRVSVESDALLKFWIQRERERCKKSLRNIKCDFKGFVASLVV